MARIGPMLVTGLLGAMNTTSALVMASSTPGAVRALSAPRNFTANTSGFKTVSHEIFLKARDRHQE